MNLVVFAVRDAGAVATVAGWLGHLPAQGWIVAAAGASVANNLPSTLFDLLVTQPAGGEASRRARGPRGAACLEGVMTRRGATGSNGLLWTAKRAAAHAGDGRLQGQPSFGGLGAARCSEAVSQWGAGRVPSRGDRHIGGWPPGAQAGVGSVSDESRDEATGEGLAVDAVNRRWVLAERPSGMVREGNFALEQTPVPEPPAGGYLVRTLYVSVDPAMRGWLDDRPSYVPPVRLGEVMRAGGLGQVVRSGDPRVPVGQLVQGPTGWQDYVLGGPGFVPVPAGVPPELAMGALGMTGMTAYFGLFEVGAPRPGETVVVSAAAGAVGSLAGQLAKIAGCRAVGIAGGPGKCAWVAGELGLDACIDYHAEDVGRRLADTCPDGVDVYFDNVGGAILDAVLGHINLRARIVACGAISVYNAAAPAPGPTRLNRLIVQRARMQGFIVSDYARSFDVARRAMGRWLAQGRLVSRSQVVDGLERTPAALCMLFTGANTGKLLVRVADPR